MKTINNKLIRSFKPCYDPSMIGIPDDETISVVGWVRKYRGKVKSKGDIIWLLCRKEFMSDKDMRLFSVWCARRTYKYCTKEHPIDLRSVAAVDCAGRFAHGNATIEELTAARDAARDAVMSATRCVSAALAARNAVLSAARRLAAAVAARNAVLSAARCAAVSAARDARNTASDDSVAALDAEGNAQIDKLLTYF
jgi:hypothetical protein